MAENRELIFNSSDEEDTDGDFSEEFKSDSDPQPSPDHTEKKSSAPTAGKSQTTPQNPPPSDDDDESDSGSDQPEPPKSHIKARKPVPKPATSPPPPTKSTAKRRAVEEEGNEQGTIESKRSRKSPVESSGVTDSSKKSPFQRVWSEADEIVILKGMIDYAAEEESSHIAFDSFLELIKKNCNVDASKKQLQGKIRKLKDKYLNNKSKGRVPWDPHELETYRLSKKIWGDEKGKGKGKGKEVGAVAGSVNGTAAEKTQESKKANGSALKKEKAVSNEVENGVSVAVKNCAERVLEEEWSSYGLNPEERILKIGAELFGGENSDIEGAEEWRKLKVKEMEASLVRLDVARARMKLVLDALQKANQ